MMIMRQQLFWSPVSALLFLAVTSSALKLTFVPPTQVPGTTLSATSSAALISAQRRSQTAHVHRASNGFTFRNLTAGSYVLQVYCPDWAFAPIRVDVFSPATSNRGETKRTDDDVYVKTYRTFLGNSWEDKGDSIGSYSGQQDDDTLRHGEPELKVELNVLGRKEYYSAREGCMYPLHRLWNMSRDYIVVYMLIRYAKFDMMMEQSILLASCRVR